ncbi:GAF domain-containing protein [Oceanibium sediminis]|uniref:GAF domain-containing protein n=1 Tax=Oceanibium sediminis TaxID=2026339 RepID=UPI000DD49CEA|nr:GAF domain-containing protein [Oceanibium sediminis]
MRNTDLPALALLPLAEAVAEARTPGPIHGAVAAFCEARFGFMLLTILRHLPDSREIGRVFSTNEEVYPIGGRKPMGDTPWGDVVLKAGRVWLGNGEADMRWAYPDAELSLSMGRDSSFCAPVRHKGRTIGVLNMSARRDSYDPADAELLKLVASFLVPALLMEG